MPIPLVVGRFNKVVTNRLSRPIAGWAPWFGMITHVGRKSGTERRTPINVFRRGDRFVFALTYGADAQWVKNIEAAGGAELETGRRHYRLTDPRLIHDPSHKLVPPLVRFVLRLIRADDFLVLRLAS